MEPKKKFDLLVAGEINPDLILTAPDFSLRFNQEEKLVENLTLTIGSSSAIFACGAARLGLRVAFCGVVGNDLFGRYMLDAMVAKGIDVSAVIVSETAPTGLSVILDRTDDRAILTYPGAIAALSVDQIDESLVQNCRHVHVGSYFLQTELQSGLPEFFKSCQERGVSTSLDLNWDPGGEWRDLSHLLFRTDVFFANVNEAMAITGQLSIEDSISKLAQMTQIVAVKMGAEGAMLQKNTQRINAPAPPVEVVDTVGAGDSFDAGFIFGYLQGWNLERCLQLGVVCGSLSTSKPGGTSAQPDLDEAIAAMHRL